MVKERVSSPDQTETTLTDTAVERRNARWFEKRQIKSAAYKERKRQEEIEAAASNAVVQDDEWNGFSSDEQEASQEPGDMEIDTPPEQEDLNYTFDTDDQQIFMHDGEQAGIEHDGEESAVESDANSAQEDDAGAEQASASSDEFVSIEDVFEDDLEQQLSASAQEESGVEEDINTLNLVVLDSTTVTRN